VKSSDIDALTVIRACVAFHAGGPRPDEVIDAPPKVLYAKMEKMVRLGLLEYGVSLGTAWPTDTGKSALAKTEPEPA
jgi:hypothetical protein